VIDAVTLGAEDVVNGTVTLGADGGVGGVKFAEDVVTGIVTEGEEVGTGGFNDDILNI
jgi:hypothetical protein